MTTNSSTGIFNSDPNRFDLQQHVTDLIITQLETGTVPWQQSWQSNSRQLLNIPKNAVTGNKYRGVNILLLWSEAQDKNFTTNEWASLKQWNQKKETIRKKEQGSMVIYTQKGQKEVDGEIVKTSFLKYSKVFNRCQLESFQPAEKIPVEQPKSLVEKIDTVEDYIENTFASIEHREGGAYYTVANDKIFMPLRESFIDTKTCTATENYYSVLLHEMTHWTGHPKRLNRKLKNKFGNDAYAEEELIAELGAAFLTAEFDITNPGKEHHAGYIASWLKVLKNNKGFIISAASEASKAVDYMQELQPLKL